MMDILSAIALLGGGGGATWAGNAFLQWRKQSDNTETQRDGLTFDLLKAAREEMSELREEVTGLRGMTAKVAHIEEALDHIHALLHAEGEAEVRAAARRASAFLKRMRPDPVEEKGEKRNSTQADISASRLKRDAEEGKL